LQKHSITSCLKIRWFSNTFFADDLDDDSDGVSDDDDTDDDGDGIPDSEDDDHPDHDDENDEL